MLKDFMNAKLNEIRALFEQKHEQYGDVDELDNFRTSAFMCYGSAGYAEMFEEAKAFQRKHIAFIEGHTIDTPKIEESLMDIAVYSLIMLYMWERNKQNRTVKDCSTVPDNSNIYYEKVKFENLCNELERELTAKDSIIKKQVGRITDLQNELNEVREHGI